MMFTRAAAIAAIFWTATKAWWDDDAIRLGASLAYYTLFALAPILLVATAVAGILFGAEAARGQIVGQLDQLVGPDGARAVQSLLEGALLKEAGPETAAPGEGYELARPPQHSSSEALTSS